MNQPPVFRIRLVYSKEDALRYTGSLDMQRIWERSFRRARLPLSYSQGFHPQPRINQALPLPLGMTSQNDLAEFWLECEVDLKETIAALRQAVPPGLEISSIETVDLHSPSLPVLVVSARYLVTLLNPSDQEQLDQMIAQLLNNTSILREKRGKSYNLRPMIEDLSIIVEDVELPKLQMQLSAREGATGRPEEVLSALAIDPSSACIKRFQLVLLTQV